MADASVAGRPCWYELGTTDLVGAGEFYRQVMDWTVTAPMVTEVPYLVAVVDDRAIAGFMLTAAQIGAPPPGWIPYFATADCAATAAAVTRAGGEVLTPPTALPGIGTVAIASDPGGAVFGVIRLSDDHAAFTTRHAQRNWHELMSRDPDAALAFYEAVLGWRTGATHTMDHVGDACTIAAGDDVIGSVMRMADDAPESVWLPYLGVSDLPETLRRVGLTGGRVMHGPADMPDGRLIAVAADPQGAWFALVGEAPDEDGSRPIPLRMT